MPKRDNDAILLEQMGHAVTDLEVRFRRSTLEERVALWPMLEGMLADYTRYRLRLLKEGTITTEEDLREMQAIKKEIDKAASKQSLLKAIARTVAFIATKI